VNGSVLNRQPWDSEGLCHKLDDHVTLRLTSGGAESRVGYDKRLASANDHVPQKEMIVERNL